MLRNIFSGLFSKRTSANPPQNAPAGQNGVRGNAPVMVSDWARLAVNDTAKSLTLYDSKGVPLHLKREDEINRGGEGIIYRFSQNGGILIKVCRPETLADKSKTDHFRRRLAAMTRLAECRNAEFLAWPLMPAYDRRGGAVGFVMRRCQGRTLRALFAPMQVKRFFPRWNRIDVAEVALNFLDAVRMLAGHHVLVNDFNPGNFLVDGTHSVRLIDCDSFQIPSGDGEIFMTRTYTPEFAAPELLLKPELFDLPRTPEQVRFSLSVVIYMLLMSGLHPFARCGGGDPAENLKSGKCPLDKGSGVRMPVSWHKSVSWLTPGLKDFFVKMFVEGFHAPEKRPLLEDLRNELVNFIEVMKSSKNANQRAILPTAAKKKER